MSRPKAYEPQQGYQYQILVKTPYDRAYEHCDYAKDSSDKRYLIQEYSMAYGIGHHFKAIPLPKKYWKEAV